MMSMQFKNLASRRRGLSMAGLGGSAVVLGGAQAAEAGVIWSGEQNENREITSGGNDEFFSLILTA